MRIHPKAERRQLFFSRPSVWKRLIAQDVNTRAANAVAEKAAPFVCFYVSNTEAQNVLYTVRVLICWTEPRA